VLRALLRPRLLAALARAAAEYERERERGGERGGQGDEARGGRRERERERRSTEVLLALPHLRPHPAPSATPACTSCHAHAATRACCGLLGPATRSTSRALTIVSPSGPLRPSATGRHGMFRDPRTLYPPCSRWRLCCLPSPRLRVCRLRASLASRLWRGLSSCTRGTQPYHYDYHFSTPISDIHPHLTRSRSLAARHHGHAVTLSLKSQRGAQRQRAWRPA
jgi:hypothetical protein